MHFFEISRRLRRRHAQNKTGSAASLWCSAAPSNAQAGAAHTSSPQEAAHCPPDPRAHPGQKFATSPSQPSHAYSAARTSPAAPVCPIGIIK